MYLSTSVCFRLLASRFCWFFAFLSFSVEKLHVFVPLIKPQCTTTLTPHSLLSEENIISLLDQASVCHYGFITSIPSSLFRQQIRNSLELFPNTPSPILLKGILNLFHGENFLIIVMIWRVPNLSN